MSKAGTGELLDATTRPPGDSWLARSGAGPMGLGLVGLFFLALGLRLVYLLQIADVPFFEFPINDAREYHQWALRIAGGEWWGGEVFYQAPAYPYLLAVVFAVTGESLWNVHVLQMIMGAGACVLMAVATQPLFGARAALVAGTMLAIYPPALYFDGIIGKMSLGLLLFAGLLAILLHFQRRPSWARMLGAGLLLGVLALTRENALALVIAIPIWIALRFGGVAWRVRAGWVGGFALGLFLVLGLVGLRNYTVGGSFVLTTSQLGTNFYIGNNPEATGLYVPLIPGRNTPTYEASDAANLAEKAVGRELSRGEVSAYWLEQGLAFVREQPGRFVQLLLLKTLYTWNAFEVSDTEDPHVYADASWLLRVGMPLFHFGILAPLAVAGSVWAWRRRRDAWLLWWLAAVYTVAVALFLAFARFRLPLVPLLLPFAGFAIVRAAEALLRREARGALAPLIAFLIAVPITNLKLFDEEGLRAASYLNVAGIMLNQRREDDALPYLERSERLAPDIADLHFHYAVYHFRQGRYAAAEVRLGEMIRLEPSDVRGWRLMASSLRRQGRPEEGARALAQARKLDPDQNVRHPPKPDRPRVVPK